MSRLSILFMVFNVLTWLIRPGQANCQSYSFETKQESYAPLNDASLIAGSFSGGQYWSGNYGFSIDYFGRPYSFNGSDGLLISSDGFVASAEYVDSTDITINTHFAEMTSRTFNSGIYGKIDSEAGSRIVKIEWRNAGLSKGDTSDYVNFQLWMYESGDIEMRFGPGKASSGSYGAAGGPGIGFYVFSLKNANFASKLEAYFLTGEASDPQLSNFKGTGIPRMSGLPENGTVYRFVAKNTSLKEKTKPSIAFPNPFISTIHVPSYAKSVAVIDMNGREIAGSIDVTNPDILDLSFIPAGIYMLRITDTNGRYYHQKIIKQDY